MNKTAATATSATHLDIYPTDTIIEIDGHQILTSRATKVTRQDGTEQFSIPMRRFIKSRNDWAATWKNGFFASIPK